MLHGNLLGDSDESRFQKRKLIIKRFDQTVAVDANHPLAGRSLTPQIELVSIDRPALN